MSKPHFMKPMNGDSNMPSSSLEASSRNLRLEMEYLTWLTTITLPQEGVLDNSNWQANLGLDIFLGVNDDGELHVDFGGKSGMGRVKNLRLNGLVLRGEGRASNGEWKFGEIDLNPYIFGGKLSNGERMLEGFRKNVEALVARNVDGFAEGWMRDVRNLRLVGDVLRYEDSIGAEKAVGLLEIVRRRWPDIASHRDVAEFYASDGARRRFDTADAENICWQRLVSLQIAEMPPLSAECMRDDGSWTTSRTDLTEILSGRPGVESGRFSVLHLQPGETRWRHRPGATREDGIAEPLLDDLRLEGTRLCGLVEGKGPTFHFSSIELGLVLKNENGRLVINSDPPFCHCCRDLFLGSTFHRQARAVEVDIFAGNAAKCRFCSLIYQAYEAYRPCDASTYLKPQRSCLVRSIFDNESSKVDGVEISLTFPLDSKDSKESVIRRCRLYNIEDSWNDSMHFRTLAREHNPQNCTFDPSCSNALARAWIDECIGSRDLCPNEPFPDLPHRFRDLGTPHPNLVRLTTCSGFTGEYACLSHCWGNKDFLTLTEDCLEDFYKCIAEETLPPTFLNAVRFCRRLNIRFLWIDALCIIQDSREDWEIESVKMNSYYANCVVCLAATTSPNANGGCELKPRPPILTTTGTGLDGLPYSLALVPEELSPSNVHFECSGVSNDHLSPRFPLLTRGWAYQERRLAPRVLHFCNDEVILECSSGFQCECGGKEQLGTCWVKLSHKSAAPPFLLRCLPSLYVIM